jgi:hypothetical protein
VDAYEQYLRAEPNPTDRGAIERRVVTLRAQIGEKKRLEAESKRTPPPAAGPGPWPFVVIGVGAATVAVGATFAVLAKQSERSADEEPIQTRAAELLDRGRTQAIVANVALAVGAVIAAAGIVWWALTPRSAPARAAGDPRQLR